ncbi:unnamed protein product [Adineta ricciae]|uniref:Uncharacterized protein n=1 Tax=Adineta ricciae TaxID=249248 RepID=A0A815P1W4_ADIRI|nr:unnamed protein product [Adineta ricciae]
MSNAKMDRGHIVLEEQGIYAMNCDQSTVMNSTSVKPTSCDSQTHQYENASTLGIALYCLPATLLGVLIDRFGCRFTKLILVIFHVIGWLTLALIKPGTDYLLYIHTVCTSLASTTVLLTAATSVIYFSKTRAFISTLYTGAFISSAMWYSIFQVIVDKNLLTLTQLSYIWMSFGGIMIFTSFLFLDWNFPVLNLPYKPIEDPEQQLETTALSTETDDKMKWYTNIYRRRGVWKHLLSPLYILVVLDLGFLLLPSSLLAVVWYPWVYYITNQNTSLGK